MVWIATVPETEARGIVKRYYEGTRKRRGFVPESLSVFSLKENSLRATQSLRVALMEGPSGLSRVQREMIAVRVSTVNGCSY